MASNLKPSLTYTSLIEGISSVKSLNVKFEKLVCVDKTAVGTMAVSTPIAEIMGKATVREHFPMQEISCIVIILFIEYFPPFTKAIFYIIIHLWYY